MATNKKISEFPVTTSLAGNDAFLINHLGSTSTVTFSSLSAAVTDNSIKLPSGATGGQVLTYNGSTTTWVASAAPKELPQTALSGQVLTYNGSTTTWVASAAPKELPQTALSGQVLTYNGSTSTWVASAGIGQSSVLKVGTAVTLTNQTSVDFTGIPSWAKRITIMFDGVSTTYASSSCIIQIGSGSIDSTGYTSRICGIYKEEGVLLGHVGGTTSTTGVIVTDLASAAVFGSIEIFLISPNIWIFTGQTLETSASAIYSFVGRKSLLGSLDRLRLTIATGTDQFNAGTVNIMWE